MMSKFNCFANKTGHIKTGSDLVGVIRLRDAKNKSAYINTSYFKFGKTYRQQQVTVLDRDYI